MRKLHLSILLLVPLLSWGDNIVPTEIGAEPFMADFKWGQMTDTGYLEPQDKPCFNYYTPAQTNCGCVATALAQVMRYWRWPSTNVCVAAEEYLCGFEGTGVTCRVESRAFGWDKMPLNPAGAGEAERQEIGHLTFDIAASVGSLFAVPEGGTIASMVTAYLRLKDRYYFSSCEGVEFVEGYPYDEEVLKQMIIPSCDYGSPVVLSVMSGESRHEIVVDGYGYEGTNFVVHVLTGGNGADDGWFRPPYFFSGGHVFSEICGGLYNILPKQTGTIISGRVRGVNGDPVGNVTVTLVDSNGVSWTARTKDSDGGRGSYAFLVPHPGACTLIATAEGLVGSNEVEVVANASPQVDVKTGAFYPSFKPTIGNTYGNDIRLQPLPGVAVQTVPTPVIDGTGTYSRVAKVSIRCADEKATVRYTTDGSEPTWASPAYEGPFDVCDSQPVTVKAKAWRDGFYASSVASGSCTADGSYQVGDDYDSPILISGTNGVRTVAFLAKYGLEDWETNGYPHVIQTCADGDPRWFYYYHTAWFKWTAPASGQVKFFASNSSTNVFGAFVSVYADGAKRPSERLTYSVGRLELWPDGADQPSEVDLPYDTPTVPGLYASGYSSAILPEDCDYHHESGWGCDQVMGYACYLNCVSVSVEAGKTYRIVMMAPYDYNESWVEDGASAFFYLKWKSDLEVAAPDHGPEPGPHPTDRHFLAVDAGGGVLEDAVRLVNEGTFVDLPETLSRDGYEFRGWYTNAADGAEADVSEGLAVNATVTVHARWQTKAYAIGYKDVAEDGPTSYTIEDLIVLAEPKPPADKRDVHFLGWSPSGMIPVGSTGDKSFVANWEHDTVTIRFDAGGGSVDEQVRTIKKNAPCGVLPSSSRVGYVFKGWFTAEEGGSPVSDETTVGADCTYFAQWEIDRFKITYDLDGGVNHPDNPSTYTMEDSVRLKSPTRKGWGFAGWEPSAGIARLSLGDRTFTARWRPSLFHVAFDANGGSGVMSNLVVEVGTTNRLPLCTFTNERTFLGWSTSATGAVVYVDGAEFCTTADVPDGSRTTLYAVWQNIPTEFGPYDPGVPYVISVPGAKGFKVSGLPSGFKWTETGTADVPACSIYGASTKTGVSTVTFTKGKEKVSARFIVGSVSKLAVVAADASWGTVSGAGAYVAGETAMLCATAKAGWVFAGWYADAEYKKPLEGSVDYRNPTFAYAVPSADATVYAKFIAQEDDVAKVLFELPEVLSNGVTKVCATVDVSGCTSLPEVSVNGLPAGLAFTARDIFKKGSETEVEYPANTIYGTATLSGTYTVVVNVVTAGKATSSASRQIVVLQNSLTEFGPYVPGVRYVIRVPDAAGFKVSGLPSGFKWTEAAMGDVPACSIYGASTKPGTNTVTFTRGDERRTAKFIVGPLPKVTVNVEDASRGSVKGAGAFVAGKKVTLKATAARDSVFNGWYDANSNCLSQAASYPYTVPANDVVLTARFIAASSDSVRVTCQTGGVEVAELTARTKDALANPVAVVAESGSLVKFKVTGLPSGLKFTANDILKKGSKDMVEVPANTIYGTPTKSGIFMVSVVATAASKKSDSKVVKFIVRATGETMVDADCDWTSGKVSGMGACASGKSRTLKATASKKYVFAGWYLDSNHTQPAEGAVDYRSPSFAVADNGTDQKFYARFVPSTEDTEVKALVEACYKLNGPWTNKLDVESLSLPSVKVKGLPPGLKFDAKALKFSGTPTKPGSYTVTLTLKNVTVKTAVTQTFALDVANIECPYLEGVDYSPDAYVYRSGVGVDWAVGACAREGYSVTGVTGLPKGLKFNSKTGKIEGVPSKTGPFTVTIKLKNGNASSLATVSMKVNAIDDWAFGSFNGGSASGQVQMTVSSVGKLSGKYFADGTVYTLSAPSYSSYDKETGRYLADVKASWSYKNDGKTVKTNDVIKVAVFSGDAGGSVKSDCFDAWQDNWKLSHWQDLGEKLFGTRGRTETYAVLSNGTFSTSSEDLAASFGESVIGKVTLTYSQKGTVKTAGEFVTGYDVRKEKYVTVKTTGSAAVCATSKDPFAGLVFVYFAPNASKSFDGHVRIVQIAK